MLVIFSEDPKPEPDEEWDCQPYEVKVPKLSTFGDFAKKEAPQIYRHGGFSCLTSLVPKVRAELTRGHPHRFLSLVRVVLISVIRRDLVQAPEYFPANVRA